MSVLDELGEPAEGQTFMMFNVAGALAWTSGFIGQSSTKCLMPQSVQYLVKGGSPGTVCLPRFEFGQSST